MNNGTGRVWAVNANGGDEGRPNGVGPVYIENIDKIGGGVPDPSGASTGDVLTVDSQGNPAWEPPTGGGGSYTAGNGIEIENDQISIDTDVVATKSDLPDMSEYATTSALTSGLAAKQDVISDLATIRSGASAGSTAVQPAALNDYATTSALTSGLAAKQDTISDLSAIRSGAQAGATAVQPAALDDYATTSALTSGLATKQDTISDLSTIRSGAALGATSLQPGDLPTVDQAYNASSTNAQSGTAVAGALATVDEVPAVTSSDDGKVLQATYSGGAGSYAWATPATVTVDQSYNASSANAQSGTAVAQAIAAIPSASYSAGNGIAISEQGAISVTNPVPSYAAGDAGKVLQVNAGGNGTQWGNVPAELPTVAGNANKVLTVNSGATGVEWATPASVTVDQRYNPVSANAQSGVAVAEAIGSSLPETKPVVAGSNVTITENANDITISATDTTYSAGTGMALTGTTFSVDNPVPASTVSDAGRVLTVNAQGAPAWGMLGSVTSIQQVSALPATPDANTLYLIPEA